jgi:hypothetical protein
MTNAQAHKLAAAQSKTLGARFVVYVPDEGADVYDAKQCAIYAPLIFVDATYVDGVKAADVRAFGESVIRVNK